MEHSAFCSNLAGSVPADHGLPDCLAGGDGPGGLAGEYLSGINWPLPKVVDPGPAGGPPADAIVLFDGKDLSKWENGEDWLVQDGAAVAQKHDIHTKQAFGDCQLHVEWAEPEKIEGAGQGRGNSGVFLMGIYEVQVLDSYQNDTYPDGQCGVDLQATPAFGQRQPQAGRVANVRHHLAGAAVRRRRQARPSRRTSRCCRTGCWCRTTSSCWAGRSGTRSPITARIRRSCRWRSSSTATRCGFGTSGSASCRPRTTASGSARRSGPPTPPNRRGGSSRRARKERRAGRSS